MVNEARINKEKELQGKIIMVGVSLVILSVYASIATPQCYSAAISCGTFHANVTNGTLQDYKLVNQTFTTFTFGNFMIKGIPALLGVIIAYFNKPITGLIISWGRKQIKVRVKRAK